MEVDRPLDTLIQQQTRPKGFRGARRGRNGRNKTNIPRPTKSFRNLPERWERDMYANNRTSGDVSSKIIISNLNFMVTDDDIRELFNEFGKIKKAYVNYDKSGRSHGTAEVQYFTREDAARAVQKYNGVSLDGRQMKVQFVAFADSAPPSFTRNPSNRGVSKFSVANSNRRLSGGSVGRKNKFTKEKKFRGQMNKNAGVNGIGTKPFGGSNSNAMVSKEALDADLDNYHRISNEVEFMTI